MKTAVLVVITNASCLPSPALRAWQVKWELRLLQFNRLVYSTLYWTQEFGYTTAKVNISIEPVGGSMGRPTWKPPIRLNEVDVHRSFHREFASPNLFSQDLDVGALLEEWKGTGWAWGRHAIYHQQSFLLHQQGTLWNSSVISRNELGYKLAGTITLGHLWALCQQADSPKGVSDA